MRRAGMGRSVFVLLLATAVITAADKLFDFLEKSRNQNNNQPNKPSPNDN